MAEGADRGYQSKGREFEPKLGQHSFGLTPIGLQSMWQSSQLLGKSVVWSTGVGKSGKT